MNALGWGLLLAMLLAGWALLDGAVQGAGQVARGIGGRDDGRRRLVLATVAPFLLLGEVWLVAAAGVLVGAFAHVEGVLWRAAYPVVVALLVAWVVRDAALWLRSRLGSPRWRRGWDAVGQGASFAFPATFGALAGVAWTQLSAVSPDVAADAPVAVGAGPGLARVLELGLPVVLAGLVALAARVHGALVVARRAPEGVAVVARRRARTALVPAAALATLAALGALGVAALGTTSALVGAVVLLGAAGAALAARFDLDRGAYRRPVVAWSGPVLALAPVVATAAVVGPHVVASAAPASVLHGLTWPVLGAFAAVVVAQAVSWKVLVRPLGPRTTVFL
ncbi:cytochrome d ubiquinol oxidase subunit II [Isoptericola sp. NEAU-Y5]|uniref:Cytochrome d ubiquinol oxidase subunit II n=1 Tax=Isoptericola luteus TaxID=2879484 RepID=A0ABS7ZHF6_9MICO|nr:cytochrome d ubiquinol oxidase subunit II [Isoptericola sp. NEAU-Y5]MCA5894458.1 cytochrome d ubiquinol oxidase subunit II [Isoptericola sp. NEAU-Y5]